MASIPGQPSTFLLGASSASARPLLDDRHPLTLRLLPGVCVVRSALVAGLVRACRLRICFGLDAICCGILILLAQAPLYAAARCWASLLSWHPLILLGTFSCGLFLLQQPFLASWSATAKGCSPLSLLVALFCAAASFLWIEQLALGAKQLLSRSSLRLYAA